ncbi:MAG: VF530 family DNA-binding protein [Tamlana sp.]
MESQPNNLLHGIKLEQIINDLVVHYGWEYMVTLRRTVRRYGHFFRTAKAYND